MKFPVTEEEYKEYRKSVIRWGIAMVTFILAVALLLTQAKADDYSNPWNMQLQDNGYYLNVNEQGQNDGWYWERYSTCGCRYSCKCYKYGWRKVKRVATIPNPREENFDEKYLNTLYNVLKWKNQERMVDRLLDVAGEDAVVEGFSEYRTTKTVKRGYGYAPNGTTYSGYSYYGEGGNNDLGYSQHSAERSLDRAYTLLDKLATRESHKGELALKFQKNLLGFEAFNRMLNAPEEEVTTWEKSGTKSYSSTRSTDPDGLGEMLALQGARLNTQDCMQCHSGSKIEADFDVTNYHLIAPEEVDSTWELIEGHLDHKLKPGMPKDLPQYTAPKKAAYKAYYYSRAGKHPDAVKSAPRPTEPPPMPQPPVNGGVYSIPIPYIYTPPLESSLVELTMPAIGRSE